MKNLSKGIKMSEYFELKKQEEIIITSNSIVFNSFIFPILIIATDMVAEVDDYSTGIPKLDKAGNQLLHIGEGIGFWVVTIGSIFLIIKAAMNGDKHKVGNVIMGAVLIYGAMFFVPWVLQMVKDIF